MELLAVAGEDSVDVVGLEFFLVAPKGLESEVGIGEDGLEEVGLALLCLTGIEEGTFGLGETEIIDKDAREDLPGAEDAETLKVLLECVQEGGVLVGLVEEEYYVYELADTDALEAEVATEVVEEVGNVELVVWYSNLVGLVVLEIEGCKVAVRGVKLLGCPVFVYLLLETNSAETCYGM